MDFEPQGHVTRHGDCLMLCTYNARTVSTNADFYALARQLHPITSPGYLSTPSSASENHHYRQLLFSDLEKVIRKENSFLKFVVDDFTKIGMPEEGEHRIGKFGPGLQIENGNRLVGLLSAARLFHYNSIFMKKEHG
ncbi:unnamed protein product [Strongylus vulgaris]|uniref:Uncharacterized protein n=1 Tax=Strongylus vulgaris TaxID=40348 RepID=A0A3P7JE49_STRVU|nr:unnamed protein product [Strongylus vulgaris]